MAANIIRLLDLLNDPVCAAIMKRDGVTQGEVIALMRSVKPLISTRRRVDPAERMAA